MSATITDKKSYCPNPLAYERFQTRTVKIGSVEMGGDNPIRVQSMTTTDTMDTEGSIAQSIRMIEVGCELVRITAPSKKDAENLQSIKDGIRARGYDTPLVADIHFTPNAAEIAARIVEKVRVNPGNYADKKKFETIEYTDESYQAELDRIRKRFSPLVEICKEEGTAMRIGTNHGSLSDRILSRYGDTPEGMVESAMEFLNICRDHDYHELVLSMKASNTQVMVQAYRLLVHRMMEEGMRYPIHLGVTEAGEGEDGRIKSAVGIGTLLEDGIGDTVRVSLTEEPEEEIPVARLLVDRYKKREGHAPIPALSHNPLEPFSYTRRHTAKVSNVGDGQAPIVIGDLSGKAEIKPASFFPFGYNYSIPLDKWNIGDQAADYLYIGGNSVNFEIPGTLGVIVNEEIWLEQSAKPRMYPLITAASFMKNGELSPTVNFISANDTDLYDASFVEKLKASKNSVLILETENEHAMPAMRRAFVELMNHDSDIPVVIKRKYDGLDRDHFQIYASTDAGGLFIDGLGDGIWLHSTAVDPRTTNSLSFGILQATRTRISKTEYISCPSCGRTLFDLQETTAKIRARTEHLKGVKIGIMGCIVNGPGEMADADYGYVGTGVGKITLYKEKEVVKRNVPSENAVDELIDLIREHGDWIEPKEVQS
ncbi:MAG TPA: (E)-4-hydroxy-3-methylbut-2-enyl-diphosphate synthase [Cryomorphaceae bacterium]|nr:(E)-4-hydroxy-3-methylbut-2-enyl-diphosphate synthase [Cryomorphaceae bacterium]